MIRKATFKDKHAIFEIACEQARRKHPELKADVARMTGAVSAVVQDPAHFAWVAVDADDKVKGALVAVTCDNLWAQRKHSQILLWQSDLPGEGLRLLIQYRKWVEAQRALRFAGLAPGTEVDAAVWKIAERAGFKAASEARILYN
mgnify:CR=1 FL=1